MGTVELKPLEWYEKPGMLVTHRHEYVRDNEINNFNWDSDGEKACSPAVNRYDAMTALFGRRILENKTLSDEELIYEAQLHRLILASCGIDCDYKAKIEL
jgi:hypothetical protein